MDLETENRIAAILLKEAAELRRQSEKEGVNVYLRNPGIRCRPNSRFISATVRGVQQANRAVEISEMWRVRHKELELEHRLKGRLNFKPRSPKRRRASSSNNKIDYFGESKGLRDEEVDDFLVSRERRGRGGVSSSRCLLSTSSSSSSISEIEGSTCHDQTKWERGPLGLERAEENVKKRKDAVEVAQSNKNRALARQGDDKEKSHSKSRKNVT